MNSICRRVLHSYLRITLSLIMTTQFSLQTAFAGTAPAATASARYLQGSAPTLAAKAFADNDPIWQQFVEAETTDFKLSFQANDPAIDQDPFFMRAQAWSRQNVKNSELSFVKAAGGLHIYIPQSDRVLTIRLPLSPIQATEEFIFLSLDTGNPLFKNAAGAGAEPGEGIFFLSRAELAQQAEDKKPVPVFFFPLGGQGWTGKLDSVAIPQMDSVVIANSTDSVALELRDVETVMKAQQINLVMASALSAKNRGAVTHEMYPAPGMTAAFGLFFTGLDLEMPSKSMWADTTYGLTPKRTERSAKWYSPVLEKVATWLSLTVQPAQAFILPPELISRLVFVGSVLTGMLAASVVLKYLHPGVRKKIKDLRASQDPIKNPVKLAGREIKETFDVFAAITSTAAQVSSVTFANSLEAFLDRFAPTVAAADHTLIRRFLKNTFYFSRNSMRNVPVNSRTFVLGAIVMGGVDTTMVAIQYEVAVPMIAMAASNHLGEDMQARINQTFDPSNPNTKQIALQDTVRNGIAYMQTGASSYSMEARAQVIENVTKEIENEMKARGIDPDDPKYQSEKEKKINEKINITMKQKGLPDQSQFLFDANTAFAKIPKMLGYKTPEEMQAKESFILENRFALSKNALDRAIQLATEWVKNDSSETAREALAVLEETARSMSFLKNGIKNGMDGIAMARAARQQLTILSYEGSVEYAVKYIPETWSSKYSGKAAQVAGLMFRQSLYSYLSAEGEELLFANNKNMAKYGELAKQAALQELKAAHPELADVTNASQLNADMNFELKLRTQMNINNMARAHLIKEKAEAFTPEKLGWIERRKQTRAQNEAEIKMREFAKTAQAATATEQELSAMKQKFFTEALARQVGLHIEDRDVARAQNREDYIKMMNTVEQKAQDQTEAEIKKNPNMARYFEKITTMEEAKLRMFIYANNFLQAYKEATTELEMVKPTDPAQPGRFQKLRQTETVRNSPFLTRSLRVLESFGDDQSMKLGLGGVLARNIPLGADLFNAHKRMMKTALSALSVSYLWSFYAWQVHMPYSAWMLLVATGAATISTPSMWLNKVFRMNGLKAMDSVLSKIAYSIPYAWVTFAGMFPIMLFSGDVGVFFSDYVRTPVMSVFSQIAVKDWLIAALGLGIITAKVKNVFKSDLSGKAQTISNLVNPKGAAGAVTCSALMAKIAN